MASFTYKCGFVAVIVAALVFGLTGCKRSASNAPQPNVIFILVDTLRADRLAAYGNEGQLAPTLEAIARDGVVFERAIAQAPWTQPSMASLFCSRNPTAHKVLRYAPLQADGTRDETRIAVFADSLTTLAELFQRRGYATAGFVANSLMLTEYGFSQGFDHYDTSFANNRTPGGVVNTAAMKWLARRDRSKPFFLYLHYMDVHGPYNAGPEFLDDLLDAVEQNPNLHPLSADEIQRLGYLRQLPKVHTNEPRHRRLSAYREYWEARYDSGVREFDRHLGTLQKQLQANGLWDGSYVIVTADHGESLCEHGYWKHGWTMYHPELHVPLILHWPGHLPAAMRIGETVRLIDVMPTIIEQLGLASPGGMQGASFAAALNGDTLIDRPATAEAIKIGPEQKAIYADGWKLIVNAQTGARRLFRIDADPGEDVDHDADRPEIAERLFQMLQRQLAESMRLAADVKANVKPATPQQVERLKSLGYIGDEGD